MSVQYFKRYTIKDYELNFKVKGVDDKAPSREMSVNRLVNQCEPEQDPLDKRIVYEMTGQKLDDRDYLDESTDQDEEDWFTNVNELLD